MFRRPKLEAFVPIIKDYIRQRDQRSRQMFVPLAHAPGPAQADFG